MALSFSRVCVQKKSLFYQKVCLCGNEMWWCTCASAECDAALDGNVATVCLGSLNSYLSFARNLGSFVCDEPTRSLLSACLFCVVLNENKGVSLCVWSLSPPPPNPPFHTHTLSLCLSLSLSCSLSFLPVSLSLCVVQVNEVLRLADDQNIGVAKDAKLCAGSREVWVCVAVLYFLEVTHTCPCARSLIWMPTVSYAYAVMLFSPSLSSQDDALCWSSSMQDEHTWKAFLGVRWVYLRWCGMDPFLLSNVF